MKNLAKPKLDTKKFADARKRLSIDYENLIKSINRHRTAAKEIQIEKTEDEGDLATMSHDRELLYNLHEGGFARLRVIQEAIKALDRGDYGKCVSCEQDINEKRLMAIPWATLCIGCQEQTESARTSASIGLASMDAEEMDH